MPKNLKENRLQRLKDLADNPQEQVLYARSLLEGEREKQALEAALCVLQDFPEAENRPLLLKTYQYYAESGSKRDPGMYLRAAILRALRPLTRQADLALLEQAALTYEIMPSRHDAEGAELRALALSIMNGPGRSAGRVFRRKTAGGQSYFRNVGRTGPDRR